MDVLFPRPKNPIEHIWDVVGKAVRARRPLNLGQLEQFVQEEWNRVPQRTCRNYAVSMRSRCRAVIVANGGHTKPLHCCLQN